MKIGFVVLAYSEISNLELLSQVILSDEQSFMYVHIDKKSTNKWMLESDRVYIGKSRNLSWGGWGLVRETKRGLKYLFGQVGVDYVFLISDAHMFLRNVDEIRAAFGDITAAAPLILDSEPLPEAMKNRIRFHFPWADRRNYKGLYTRLIVQVELRLRKFFIRSSAKGVMYGSQWFGVSRFDYENLCACIRWYPSLSMMFRFSLIPDEMYFQSFFNLAGIEPSLLKHTAMTWEQGSGPEFLNFEDCIHFEGEGFFFARKCRYETMNKWYRRKGWV